jgi:RNA polymerase sigma-70 factor (ECF subfamily)
VDDATGVDALSDDETLDAARRGSREARGRLLCALQDPWYRMCLSLLADAELARDAAQETAVRFLRQLPGFRGDSQLRTWSLGIALNVVREMKRRRGRERSLGEGDVDGAEPVATGLRMGGDPGPDAGADLNEQRERLRATLADLPDRQREAVVLRFFEDLSVEETAAAMKCAEGTVKATVHQALRSLRNRMRQFA